jgi:predicted RNA binding protein YcfA (HicA-like mRNA interferase family)
MKAPLCGVNRWQGSAHAVGGNRPLSVDPEHHAVPKVREALKLLQGEGWYVVRVRGSHRILKHAQRPGTVTLAGRPSVDIPRGTWLNIRKQAGLADKDHE